MRRVLSKHKKECLHELLGPLKWIYYEETAVSRATRKAAEEVEKQKKAVVRKVKHAKHAAAESIEHAAHTAEHAIESVAHAADDRAHAAAHRTRNLLHLLPEHKTENSEEKPQESTAEVCHPPRSPKHQLTLM